MDEKTVQFDYSDEEYEQIKKDWEKAVNRLADDSDNDSIDHFSVRKEGSR